MLMGGYIFPSQADTGYRSASCQISSAQFSSPTHGKQLGNGFRGRCTAPRQVQGCLPSEPTADKALSAAAVQQSSGGASCRLSLSFRCGSVRTSCSHALQRAVQTLGRLPGPPAKLPHRSSLQRAVPADSHEVMNTRGGCGSVPRTCAASLPLWRRRRGVARAMTETTEQPRPPEVAAPYLLQGCCLAAVRAASPQQRCACRRPPMAPTTRRALKRHWAASRRACSASRWPPAPAPAPLAPSGPAGQRGPRLACQCACLADLRAPGVARPSAPRLGRGARGTGARRGVAGRARGPCHTAVGAPYQRPE